MTEGIFSGSVGRLPDSEGLEANWGKEKFVDRGEYCISTKSRSLPKYVDGGTATDSWREQRHTGEELMLMNHQFNGAYLCKRMVRSK